MNDTKKELTIDEKLAYDVPASEIDKRKGPGGRELSYISGYTATTHLNKVFGAMGWDFHIEKIKRWFEQTDDGKYRASVECRGYISVHDEDSKGKWHTSITKTDLGYGHGTAYTLGEAMESAGKEARTDCLKRCAKDFGNYTGLCLYKK